MMCPTVGRLIRRGVSQCRAFLHRAAAAAADDDDNEDDDALTDATRVAEYSEFVNVTLTDRIIM